MGNVVALHSMQAITTHILVPYYFTPEDPLPTIVRFSLEAGVPGVTLLLDTSLDPPGSAERRQEAWDSLCSALLLHCIIGWTDASEEVEVQVAAGHMTPVVPLGFSALIPPAALFVIDVAVRNELTAFLRSTRQSIPESPPRGADPELLSHILVGSPSDRSSDALYAAASFAGLSREVSAVPGVDDSCGFETAFHQWRVFGLISDQTHNDLLDASRFVGKITVGNVVALHDMVGITYTHVFVPCWPSPARCQEPIYFRAMLRAGDPGVTLSLDTRHDPPDSAGCRQTAWNSLKLSIARYMQSDGARRGSYEDRTSEV